MKLFELVLAAGLLAAVTAVPMERSQELPTTTTTTTTSSQLRSPPAKPPRSTLSTHSYAPSDEADEPKDETEEFEKNFGQVQPLTPTSSITAFDESPPSSPTGGTDSSMFPVPVGGADKKKRDSVFSRLLRNGRHAEKDEEEPKSSSVPSVRGKPLHEDPAPRKTQSTIGIFPWRRGAGDDEEAANKRASKRLAKEQAKATAAERKSRKAVKAIVDDIVSFVSDLPPGFSGVTRSSNIPRMSFATLQRVYEVLSANKGQIEGLEADQDGVAGSFAVASTFSVRMPVLPSKDRNAWDIYGIGEKKDAATNSGSTRSTFSSWAQPSSSSSSTTTSTAATEEQPQTPAEQKFALHFKPVNGLHPNANRYSLGFGRDCGVKEDGELSVEECTWLELNVEIDAVTQLSEEEYRQKLAGADKPTGDQ